MLTLKDCIDLSDLSDAEVAAIAEHEHVPEIVAAEIGCELVNTPAGRLVLKRYIRENLVHAKAQHMDKKAKALALILRRFDGAHSTTRARST
jgi:hypothetical protein